MPARSLSIKSVTPETRKHWSVKVQVVEKSPPRKAANGLTTFQRLILLDREGTRVQASLFGDAIEKFQDTFHILHKYEISNAFVKPIDEKHRIVDHDYQWTINAKTPVLELHDDEESSQITPVLTLVKFEDFHKYVDSQAQIDVLGAVIDVLPEKKIQKKDGTGTMSDTRQLIIINQEKKPTTVTLWDHFVGNEGVVLANRLHEWPIILAMRIRVVSYNGLSLSTRGGSTFLVNPPLPEVETLRTWIMQNKDIIKESKYLHNCESKERSAQLLHKQVAKVSEIPASPENDKVFVVIAKMSITNKVQNFWYMSCNKCYRGIDAEYEKIYSCRYCKKTATAEPRCRFEIEVTDLSGSITATIFGKNAEEVFSFTALMLMRGEVQVDKLTLDETEIAKEYLIRLKATHYEYRNKPGIRFSVVSVSEAGT